MTSVALLPHLHQCYIHVALQGSSFDDKGKLKMHLIYVVHVKEDTCTCTLARKPTVRLLPKHSVMQLVSIIRLLRACLWPFRDVEFGNSTLKAQFHPFSFAAICYCFEMMS